jgi:hypothetical protein
VKVAKGDIYSQANSIPELKFEDQQLTSFAGLVVFQKLFRNCRLKQRMEESCAHLLGRHYYSFSAIVQCLCAYHPRLSTTEGERFLPGSLRYTYQVLSFFNSEGNKDRTSSTLGSFASVK